MSSPDRIIHRGASRRWEYKQQPQQELISSSRPVSRAHLNLDGAYNFERESTRRSNAPSKNGTRLRNNIRTRTLKDAFEATSRTVAMDSSQSANNEKLSLRDRTPSPSNRHQRRSTLPSPYAEVTSPPPGELLETYQRINDADDLADLVSEDDLDVPENGISSRRSSKERRKRDSPTPKPLNLHFTREERNDNLGSVFSYLDDVTDDYVRGKLSSYKRDEERLNRVTTSQSPVFSKAKVGSKADGLQRRDSDPQTEQAQDLDGDDEVHTGLNVPKSWGNKAKNHRQWLSSITGNTPRGESSRRSSERERRTRVESRSRSPQLTDKSPSRRDYKVSEDNQSRSERSRIGAPPSDGLHNIARTRSRSSGRSGITGDSIPNTPITVYKSTSRDRSQKLRSDSRELLRKLARTESPNQQSTPEPQKPAEGMLPEKTPVVIGAWIDTPMTVQNASTTRDDDTKEIDSPSKTASKSTVAPKQIFKLPIPDNTSRKEPSKKDTTERTKETSKSDIAREKIDSNKQPKAELIKPKLPKSALESIVEDAKLNGNPLLLGDDTINSLQGLMVDDNVDKKPSRFTKIEKEELKQEFDVIESDGSQQQKDDSKDLRLLDRLSSKLRSIIHSIHDARTGLNGLEETIRDGHVGHCETCGNTQYDHKDGRIYIAIPVPRLWQRDHSSRRLRLTYLGWTLIILSCWYISESTMCDYYCHPTIAEVCDGYCLQLDAPQFPFTLPTMLWRWSHLSDLLAPIFTILIAAVRLVSQLLGVWDGYVDDTNLADAQWSSSSSAYFGEIPIGSSEHERRSGFFGLWSGGGIEKEGSSPRILTSAAMSATTAAASASIRTILQKVIQNPEEVEIGDSMDGDEIL